MSPVTVTAALATGIVIWVLVVRRLTAKSWEHREQEGDVGAIGVPAARIGLWVFLAVVTSLFALFLSAYSMRMHHGGEHLHVALPASLWLNTLVLVAASVALQFARRASGRDRALDVRNWLVAAGALTLLFLAGQLYAWQQLGEAGYFIQGSPPTAFFYLLTAVHGLHLLGGLWVWGRTVGRLLGGAELVDLRLSVELCSEYWHWLLLVWIAVFAVLSYL